MCLLDNLSICDDFRIFLFRHTHSLHNKWKNKRPLQRALKFSVFKSTFKVILNSFTHLRVFSRRFSLHFFFPFRVFFFPQQIKQTSTLRFSIFKHVWVSEHFVVCVCCYVCLLLHIVLLCALTAVVEHTWQKKKKAIFFFRGFRRVLHRRMMFRNISF